MRKNINLLSGRKKVDVVFKKIFSASVAIFCIAVVVSIGLIFLSLYLKSNLADLEAENQVVDTQLASLQEKKDKLQETKNRLAEIRKVLNNRAPVTLRIEQLADIVPALSKITGMSGNDDEIQITLESDDLASLNELIELRVEELARDKKRGIKRVEMQAFEINPRTLRYSISFEVQFI